MTPDLSKLLLHTSYNAFKNNSVQRGTLALPTSLTPSQVYTDSVTFTLSENAAFIQAYVYATDYGDYFNFTDGAYHDGWRMVNTNNDYLIFGSYTLLNYYIRMSLNGNQVTFTLYVKNASHDNTMSHPTHTVPITFIDYTLAN